MSARAKGRIYVALFLLALGVGVPVFVALESEERLLALGVAALPVLGGAVIYACYACIQAYRAVWKAASLRPGNDPEEPAPQRSSFRTEYARKFSERASGDGHDAQLRHPAPNGQDGIAPDER